MLLRSRAYWLPGWDVNTKEMKGTFKHAPDRSEFPPPTSTRAWSSSCTRSNPIPHCKGRVCKVPFLKPRNIEVQATSPSSARVVMEPFERGYGHTLGNALRRVLLSSMPGYAPTEYRSLVSCTSIPRWKACRKTPFRPAAQPQGVSSSCTTATTPC